MAPIEKTDRKAEKSHTQRCHPTSVQNQQKKPVLWHVKCVNNIGDQRRSRFNIFHGNGL
jgi:hypothetical protein